MSSPELVLSADELDIPSDAKQNIKDMVTQLQNSDYSVSYLSCASMDEAYLYAILRRCDTQLYTTQPIRFKQLYPLLYAKLQKVDANTLKKALLTVSKGACQNIENFVAKIQSHLGAILQFRQTFANTDDFKRVLSQITRTLPSMLEGSIKEFKENKKSKSKRQPDQGFKVAYFENYRFRIPHLNRPEDNLYVPVLFSEHMYSDNTTREVPFLIMREKNSKPVISAFKPEQIRSSPAPQVFQGVVLFIYLLVLCYLLIEAVNNRYLDSYQIRRYWKNACAGLGQWVQNILKRKSLH